MTRIQYIPNRVIDINGISDGANVFVYQSGTTTPVALFSDASLETPLANPRIVPAGAEIPIFYTSYVGPIRLRVVNSDGDVSQDEDPYTSPVGVSDLSATTGSGLIGYIAPGTGSIPVTLKEFIDSLPINAKLKGAAFDGVTDDSAALQRAVNDAQAQGGGIIQLPAKPMLIENTVMVSGSGVQIRGSSHGSTRIINGSASSPAIQFGDETNLGYRNGIENIIFGGKDGVTPVEGNCGLLAIKQSNFTASNVQAFQFPGKLYDGVIFDQVTQSYIDRFGLQDAINRNLAVTNQCVDITATNGRCDAGGIGVEFRDVQGMHFVNWTCYGNVYHGWSAVTDFPVVGFGNRFFYFTNCVGDTSGSHNWNVRQLSVAIFTACWGSTQLSSSQIAAITGYPGLVVDPLADGFHFNGEDAESLTLNGCFAISNNRHGLAIWNARSVHLAGCMLGSDFAPDDFGGDGANNGKGGAGSGLYIGAEAYVVTATGGHYEHNTSYGVDIADGAQNVTINGVDLRFNDVAQVRNLANATAHQAKLINCGGYNPLGFVAAPAVPASGTAVTNLSGVDCVVYLADGTVTSVLLGGQEVLRSTNASFLLAAGDTITVNYSVAPTWTWRGN